MAAAARVSGASSALGGLLVLGGLMVLGGLAACGATPVAPRGRPPGVVMPAVSVAGAPVPGAQVPGDPSPGTTSWQGLDRLPCPAREADTTVVKVAPDTALDGAWTSYADTAAGWTGGDSVHAYRLGGARVLWTFADSFLGPLGPGGTRPPTEPLIHSLFVVQHGDRFQTVTGGAPGRPVSLVTAAEPSTIYLGLAGLQTAGRLQEFLLDDRTWPDGAVSQVPTGTLLATYALPSLRRLSLVPLAQESAAVQWGAAVLRVGGDTYVYGATAAGNDKALYVARVRGTDLARAWRYWDGLGWSRRASTAAPVARGVSAEVSVTEVDGMAVLVTTPTTTPYSAFVVLGTACSPTGPFRLAADIRDTYATGSVGLRFYGVNDVYAYDAMDQPAFNRGSTWLISFDQNVLRYSDLARNAAIYRPQYLWVQLGPKPGARATSGAA